MLLSMLRLLPASDLERSKDGLRHYTSGTLLIMSRRNLLLSVAVVCIFAYWGAQRGSYEATYYWAKIAEEQKEKNDAELEQRQNREASELRSIISKGLDRESKERWDKYDQCLRLGSVKARQPGASELVLSIISPTWMQYCLTGTISKPTKDSSTTTEAF